MSITITPEVLSDILNTAIPQYEKNKIHLQNIQDKPLLNAMQASRQKFIGASQLQDTVRVFGDYKDNALQTYSGTDRVSFDNPTGIKQATYVAKEFHHGIGITETELKNYGILVGSGMGAFDSMKKLSANSMFQFVDQLQNKLEVATEQVNMDLNKKMWLDGVSNPGSFVGLTGFISDTPTVGAVGGIDAAANTWWRNRALVGANKIVASAANQTLTKRLRQEVRQLARYTGGGKPAKYLILAGSTALEALDLEITAKGDFTQTNFTKSEATDFAHADYSMKGVGTFKYDPTLDSLGYADRIYFIDTNSIFYKTMEEGGMAIKDPARPHDQFAVFRSMVITGHMTCNRRNTSGVYQVALA